MEEASEKTHSLLGQHKADLQELIYQDFFSSLSGFYVVIDGGS